MAIAHDAWSESHTSGNTGSVSEASFSWTHTPAGTPAAAYVAVFTMADADYITSVTYGGVAMAQEAGAEASDPGGEPARVTVFSLESGVPTGPQTVEVTRTNNATGMSAECVTVTSGAGAEFTGVVLLDDDGTIAEQNVDDGSPGTNSVRYAAGYYGRSGIAAGASSTSLGGMNMLAGSASVMMVRETTAGQGSRAIGFSNGTSDDRAVVHWAVREVAAGGITVTPTTVALVTTTFAPTIAHKIIVPLVALTVTTFAPTVTVGVRATPTTASLTLTTFAPTVSTTAHQTVTPTTASLTLTTFAPTIVVGKTVTPTTASLSLTTFAPTIAVEAVPIVSVDGNDVDDEILDRSMTMRFNAFDFTLVSPSVMPQLDDAVVCVDPAWEGVVTQVKVREYRGGTTYVTVTATNEEEAGAGPAPFGLDEDDYSDLEITTTKHEGSTETRGQLVTWLPGLWPAMTFELTSANHGYTDEEFTITDVTVTWPKKGAPRFALSFGDPIVTLSVYLADPAAGVLPITSTKITDGAVTTPKIAANAVTAAKIEAGTITATEIASNAITTAKLDALAVTAAKIDTDAITTAKIAAGAVTADEIGAGAITTAKLNASAVIALVTNSGATVVIDSAGITVEDGAIVIKDEWGYTSLGASGFDGSWADVVQTGLYNGLFLQGVNGSIANGRTADLPYWTASIESGATAASYDSTNKYVTFNFPSATNSAALLSDRVAATGGGYYAVECTMTTTAPSSSDVLTVGGLLFCYDQDGSFISSVQSLTRLITSSSLSTTTREEGTAVALPDDTRYVRVQLVATQTSGTSGAVSVHDVTLKPAPATQLDDLQVVVNTLSVTNTAISTNIRGSVLIPFSWTGTLPGSSTQDLDIFGAGTGIPQLRMPFDGSVIAVCVGLATARTAGTLTARAYNGSSSSLFGPTATIDGTTTNNDVATGDIDDATFDATNFLRLRVTTSSFTPTSNTVLGYLVVQYKVE